MNLTVAGAYVDSMYTGLCGAYARAKALGPALCLALCAIIYYEVVTQQTKLRGKCRGVALPG